MEHIIRVRAVGIMIILALGVAVSAITSTVVASRAYKGRGEIAARAAQDITVKGSARLRVQSDLGTWRIDVSGDGAELKQAYETLAFGVDRVQAFLAEQHFSDGEIALSAIDTSEHHVHDKEGRESPQISGYTLRRCFTITSPNVQQMAQAAGEVTRLLQENVRVSSAAPQFTFTKATDMKIAILGEASKDARERADQIARNAGCRVGEIRKAVMGVIQITQPNSTDVSGYGIYDTSTIEKDVSVVVTVTFGID